MDLNQKLEMLKAEYIEHGVKTVYKSDSKFWVGLQKIIKILTLGLVSKFLADFSTTIGKTVYLKDGLEGINLYSVMVHEMVHIKQAEKYSSFLFGLLYLLAPIPIGLAWYRFKFEREAYLAGGKAYLEFYPELDKGIYADHVASNLGGSAYLWAWPKKKVKAWILANLR